MAWDGAAYAGWQSQQHAASVQDELWGALQKLLPGCFRPVAAGRTDTGVHASAMPVHVDAPLPLRLPPERLARALNAYLRADVAVLEASLAPAGMHARFSCTERRYIYRIYNAPQRHPLWAGRALHVPQALDTRAMQAAALPLIGTHDFAAFATQEDRQTVRELRLLELRRQAELLEIELHGESFLRHMVRGLVGTLLQVGLGKLPAEAVAQILGSRQRARAGANVPACGLYFIGARYDAPMELPSGPPCPNPAGLLGLASGDAVSKTSNSAAESG